MGWLLLILVSHVAGIVWADRGGAWPTQVGVVANGAALALGLGLAVVCALGGGGSEGDGDGERKGDGDAGGRARRFAGRARATRRGARVLAMPLLAASSAAWGHAGLARELERARIGAERAEALGAEAILRVDARVRARRPTGFGEEVELGAVRARAGEGAVPERLLLTFGDDRRGEASRAEQLLVPGAEVRLAVRIRPLHPTRNPGSPDRAHAFARRGIAARARLLKSDWVVERIDGPGLWPRAAAAASALRRAANERVRVRLESLGDGQGLVRALALGDRRGLSEPTRADFRRLGLTHLLSVSGLHIGFVAWPAAWGIHRLRLRLRVRRGSPTILGFLPSLVAGSAAAGCYAWLAGAEVPAVRASLLFALFAASRSLGWRVAPAPALAAIALVLLVADPAVLFDLGAQLSFGACAALVVGGVWGRGTGADPALPPAPDGSSRGVLAPAARAAHAVFGLVGEAVRTSLVVSLGMLPLVELQGLPRALPSPVVNALAIPWTGVVVLPCALGAALLAALLAGLLPASAALPDGAAEPGGLGTLLLEGLLAPVAGLEHASARLVAALPAAWIDDDRMGWIPWPVAIGGIAFALHRLRSGALAAAAGIWIGLAALGLEPWPEPAFARTRPRLVFLDVGQADAALLQTRASSWLVDAGPGAEDGSGGAALVRALRAEGVRRLDVLVLTHGDLDHRGGALRVLSAVDVAELWLPRLATPDPALERIADFAATRGTRVRRVAAGDRRTSADGLGVEVLWPPRPSQAGSLPTPSSGRARNERSLVLAVDLAGLRALLMADVGAEVEAMLRRTRPAALRSDVLKAGHHGSRQSSTAGFLAAVAPRVAIVSAPCQGARGLPSEVALQRLRASGAMLGWTGRDGALLVTARGAGPPAMRYWGAPRRCAAGFERSAATGRRDGE